ncbi:MAG: magnesium chelatase ATPase subunit I [Rhodospirillaceae bacterium]|nr:magnesium chelatase ATPase subunit I [Rhodospirillaceae bacterium]
MAQVFPFAAVVGQDDMKLALMIAATDPTVGGVMVFGDRGTGKSTTIRSLAALLPPMKVVKGCAFNCDPTAPKSACASVCAARSGKKKLVAETVPVPVVDLPLGATEDRVVGALDLERALTRGERAFEAGLLARANRGFLYIDEVNLLEDHLVDLLLDVAASGENIVEREGLSVRHPARFVLVGRGNPEEGELRPQLLDRFGLSVEVRTPQDIEQRIEVLRRRDAFERAPEAFAKFWAAQNAATGKAIAKARAAVGGVTVDDDVLTLISKLCVAVGADGLRGELTIMRAARAAAALYGATTVGVAHVRRVAALALRHRLRRNPLDQSGSGARIERAMAEVLPA